MGFTHFLHSDVLTCNVWRTLPSVSLAAWKFSSLTLALMTPRPWVIRARPSMKASELKWCGALKDILLLPGIEDSTEVGHTNGIDWCTSWPTCQQNLGLPVHSENIFPVERRETWHRTLHLLLWGRDRPRPTPRGMDPLVEWRYIKNKIIKSLEKEKIKINSSAQILRSDLEIELSYNVNS